MEKNTDIGSLLTDRCIFPADDRAMPAKRESEALECGGECKDNNGAVSAKTSAVSVRIKRRGERKGMKDNYKESDSKNAE